MAADRDWIEKTLDGLQVRARPHTPLQMAAFYEARGFPTHAIRELDKACFMTISVVNLRRDIVWLEPHRWVMRDKAGRAVPLLEKVYWDKNWQRHGVPAGARAAFRWTQLPRLRDLRPEEPVGGNISFIPRNGPFSLELRFSLGADKGGSEVNMRLTGLSCGGRS
jgi:hypothetical protein